MRKKQRIRSTDFSKQALTILQQVLIEHGFMLPCSRKHVTQDDLSMFGKGSPKTIGELEQSAFEVSKRDSHSIQGPDEIVESLAMLARNGKQISESVRVRMRRDRIRAEKNWEKQNG